MSIKSYFSGLFELSKVPVYQSLVLLICTVFVFGCQAALWLSGSESSMLAAFVVLSALYALKGVPVLLREINDKGRAVAHQGEKL